MKCCCGFYRKLLVYFSRHPLHNALVHILVGMGLGILLTYPLVGRHPLRWGIALLVLGVLGHLWVAMK